MSTALGLSLVAVHALPQLHSYAAQVLPVFNGEGMDVGMVVCIM
jgi:hypothetical protein